MSNTTQRQMNMASVKGIMNKRILIPASAEGKSFLFTIQGNGNVIDVKNKAGELVQSIVEEGTVLQKTIFNTRANSGHAMGLEINKQLLKDAVAAERAGDATKAHELFNKYLNAVQISLSVLHPSSLLSQLSTNVDIKGKVQKITTDNGSLLTIDPSSISVVAPEIAGTTNFSFDELEEAADDEAAKEAEELAAKIAADAAAKAAKAAKKNTVKA